MSSSVLNLTRRLWWAVAAPIRSSIETGHLRSCFSGKPVDRKGRPIPCYTYPAIHFMAQLDTSKLTVLEFGGGHSTLWWASRAANVFTVEGNRAWFEYLKRQTAKMTNVELFLRENSAEYAALPLGKTFDIVVLDGGPREICAKTAVKVVNPTGMILFDDSEGYPGKLKDGSHPTVDEIQDAGFMRVDFYGTPSAGWKPHCTSLFFRPECSLLRKLSAPVRRRVSMDE